MQTLGGFHGFRQLTRSVLPHPSNPTLAYLYRRFLTRRLLHQIPAGKFLEIGVGSGRFYEELEERGFSGLCLDLNPDLIRQHQTWRKTTRNLIEFRSFDFFALREKFDLILAFEVLEHYQDDEICLRKWESLLGPKGTLIFSVPAHMRQWTRNDARAGHARRYEKNELLSKLAATSFHTEVIWCYGFPILNWTYPLSSVVFKNEPAALEQIERQCPALAQSVQPSISMPADQIDCDYKGAQAHAADFERTSQSGNRGLPGWSNWIFHEWLWFPWLQLQRPFLEGNRGIGFIVKCRKN